MSREQAAALDGAIRSDPIDLGQSPSEHRADFEQAPRLPLPEDVHTEEVTVGGVPAVSFAYNDSATATLLYMHGGGYMIGSPWTSSGITAALARGSGASAVSLAYRLAPENPYPAALEDAVAGYRGLLDSGVDPAELVVAGDSAGGGLGVAMLLTARDAGLPQPAGLVLMSPWADLTLAGESMMAKQNADPLFAAEIVQWYADNYVPDGNRGAELISPAFADLDGLPQMLIQVGSHEVLLDDAVRLAARAGAADLDVTLEVVAGVPHVFQLSAGMLDEADDALDRAARFLRDVLEHRAA